MPIVVGTPPTIQTSFGAFMQAQDAIAQAVAVDEQEGVAIYYGRGPQDSSADPYLSYIMTYEEEQEVGGPPAIASARVYISCKSQNPDIASALAEVVRSVFRYTQNAFPMGPCQVLGTWVVSTDDTMKEADFGLFEAVVEVGMQFELPTN